MTYDPNNLTEDQTLLLAALEPFERAIDRDDNTAAAAFLYDIAQALNWPAGPALNVLSKAYRLRETTLRARIEELEAENARLKENQIVKRCPDTGRDCTRECQAGYCDRYQNP